MFDLTPLSWKELSDEEWYNFVIDYYKSTWLTYFVDGSLRCETTHPFDFENMQTCIRPRNHLGPHACGGNHFCYTSFKLWDSRHAIRYNGSPASEWRCIETKYFSSIRIEDFNES